MGLLQTEMPAFVFARNHVTWLKGTIAALEKVNCRVTVVDLGSTYPPMLEFLSQFGDVIFLGEVKKNPEPWDLWELKIEYGVNSISQSMSLVEYFLVYILGTIERRFIATDFDLNLDIGKDFIPMMHHIMNNYPDIVKCGPALHWQDAQTSYHKYEFINEVEEWENQFWDQKKLINVIENTETFERFRLYDASIDTTFAMYELGRIIPARPDPGKGIRIDADNTSCIHIPWTMPAGEILVDEETLYCVMSCRDGIGHWTSKMKKLIIEKMTMIDRVYLALDQKELKSGSPDRAGEATVVDEEVVVKFIHIKG